MELGGTPSAATELLKVATALKKDKKLKQACEKLKEAYMAEGGEFLPVESRLRLPMYLQAAGENEQGLEELKKIVIDPAFSDVFSQLAIANQMRIFFDKEKNYHQSLVYLVWALCKGNESAYYSLLDKDLSGEQRQYFTKAIESRQSIEGLKERLQKPLKKIGRENEIEALCAKVADYLRGKKKYDINAVIKILSQE